MRTRILSGLGGGLSTAADVAVLATLVQAGAPVPVSAFVASMVGAVVCFLMNKYVAFRDRSRVRPGQLAAFGLVAVTTALIMAFAMKLLAVDLGVPYLVAKLVCAAVVFVFWSYPAQKYLVFRVSRAAAAV